MSVTKASFIFLAHNLIIGPEMSCSGSSLRLGLETPFTDELEAETVAVESMT